MSMAIDAVIAFLTLGLAYALMSEGAWGAALMFFNVIFAGLIAFNFYEPLAALIDSTGIGWGFSDCLSLFLIFAVAVMMLRMTTETIAPAMVRLPVPIYHLGRLVFGVAGAAVTMSIVLLGFHTAPVHKKLFTTINYDSKPPFGLGLDHRWLGFFQYTTGSVFAQYGSGSRDPFREYGRSAGGNAPLRLFDPRAQWLLQHQEVRPYGEGPILKGGGGDAAKPAAPGQGGAGRPGQGRNDGPPI